MRWQPTISSASWPRPASTISLWTWWPTTLGAPFSTRRGAPISLSTEAAALRAGLEEGRWQLTEGAYRFYLGEAHRWLGREAGAATGATDALAVTECAGALWLDWRNNQFQGDRARGRRSAWFEGRSLLEMWRGTDDGLVALVATGAFLELRWLSGLQPTLDRLNLRIALADPEGHAVFRAPFGSGEPRVVRSAAETGLPWALHVAAADPSLDLAQLSARRRFVLAGFGLTGALLVVAGYVIARAVGRELDVARLQSDFVSAVSHEFRTPLATLRQVSEMLADGRVPSEERRNQYYEDLRHESERLHRLVEDLLDFGRMEAGRREYRFEKTDASALARRVVADFAQEVAARGYVVEISVKDHPPGLVIRADQEALGRALWNLLDNAVKYFPNAKTVRVDVRETATASC